MNRSRLGRGNRNRISTPSAHTGIKKKDFVQKYDTRRSTPGLRRLNGIVCRVPPFILTGLQRTYLFVCVFFPVGDIQKRTDPIV